MRSTLAVVTLLLSAFPAAAQTYDFTKWKVEHFAGSGTWKSTKLFNEFTNGTNYDISVLYSDVSVSVIDFILKVATDVDDDIVGFVLGFQPGDSKNNNCDYLLVDWKKTTQSYSNWGKANQGLAVSRVTGVGTVGTVPGLIDFWSHTLNVKELARGTNYGNVGWASNVPYRFRVIFGTSGLNIWVNGAQEFKLTGTFKAGRFGCYNFSQSRMQFTLPFQGSFKSLGRGCKGTVGTPFLFGPTPPTVGKDLVAVVSNIPSTAGVNFVLGLSNSTWGSIPLPFNLGLIGGTGCTLYTSTDAFIPMTNYNGTGAVVLTIPSDPSLMQFQFYGQAMVKDQSANSLGIVMSNAATVVIGN